MSTDSRDQRVSALNSLQSAINSELHFLTAAGAFAADTPNDESANLVIEDAVERSRVAVDAAFAAYSASTANADIAAEKGTIDQVFTRKNALSQQEGEPS